MSFEFLLKTVCPWTLMDPQLSVTHTCCASPAFHTDACLVGDNQPYHPPDLCGSAGGDSPVTVTVAHLKAPQWIHGSLVSDRTGAVWLVSLWLSSPLVPLDPSRSGIWVVCQREKQKQSDREVLTDSKCTFSFAVPSGGENATTTEVKEKDNMAFPCPHA